MTDVPEPAERALVSPSPSPQADEPPKALAPVPVPHKCCTQIRHNGGGASPGRGTCRKALYTRRHDPRTAGGGAGACLVGAGAVQALVVKEPVLALGAVILLPLVKVGPGRVVLSRRRVDDLRAPTHGREGGGG